MTPTQDDIAAIARVTGWVAFQQYTGDVLLIDDLSCMEPWSNDADAIAALKAWRERDRNVRWVDVTIGGTGDYVRLCPRGNGHIDATLPSAACAALIEADRRERSHE